MSHHDLRSVRDRRLAARMLRFGALPRGSEAFNAAELSIRLSDPTSFELFVDPVVASSGHTFERGRIEAWLRTNDTCPITREKITRVLIPNRVVKATVIEFVATYGSREGSEWDKIRASCAERDAAESNIAIRFMRENSDTSAFRLLTSRYKIPDTTPMLRRMQLFSNTNLGRLYEVIVSGQLLQWLRETLASTHGGDDDYDYRESKKMRTHDENVARLIVADFKALLATKRPHTYHSAREFMREIRDPVEEVS
jgi:hypothetical protein